MATLVKRRVLFNPGRKRRKRANGKRKMSIKQIRIFGTPAQKAALKRRRKSNPSVRRKRKRRANIGEIVTLSLGKRSNSGRKRRKRRTNTVMARPKRRRRANSVRRRRVSRANPVRRRRRRRANIGVTRRRRRRANPVRRARRRRVNSGVRRRRRYSSRANSGRRRYSRRRSNSGRRYRRNVGVITNIEKALGVTAGAVVTNYAMSWLASYSPSLTSGPLSYATIIALGMAEGWVVSKFLKKPQLGENIAVGAIVLAAIKAVQQYLPTVSTGLSGFRRRGLGVLGASSFTYPQVLSKPGNFAQFQIAPDYSNYVNSQIANSMPAKGMGAIFPAANGGSRSGLRRVGRAA